MSAMSAWLVVFALPLRVAFLSVGQGDATLITSPQGKQVLVDGGPHEAAGALTRALRKRGAQPLDLVVLSHRHADHLGGLEQVIATLGTRGFLDSAYPHESPAYTALLALLDARHIPVREARAGRRIDLGGEATLELLTPPEPPIEHARSPVNANSVVARLDFRKLSLLLTGDAEAPTERWLLARHANVRARVLKVAHHGSSFSSTPRFLRAVAPELAVICVGANSYGHPDAGTVARLEAAGARVLRTDRDGDIELRSDGEQLTVTTQRATPASAAEATR